MVMRIAQDYMVRRGRDMNSGILIPNSLDLLSPLFPFFPSISSFLSSPCLSFLPSLTLMCSKDLLYLFQPPSARPKFYKHYCP